MNDEDYRLPAHPRRTIREKQGSHRDLSNCRLDYTPRERAVYASIMEKEGRRVKEAIEAWERRDCDKARCSAVNDILRNWSPTCRKIMQCSWARNRGINDFRVWPAKKTRIVSTYTHKK